ncbi:MAG: hypothetical protein PWQ97_30 [Tepidanaerobacteraceae bacterium]|nr:hypothetical protein [Tepidanaerobacteraceae bacterium]
MEKLQNTVNKIAPLDRSAAEKASLRLDSLTKPQGSLAFLIIEAATRIQSEMATFESAGVSGKIIDANNKDAFGADECR